MVMLSPLGRGRSNQSSPAAGFRFIAGRMTKSPSLARLVEYLYYSK